MRDKLVNFTLKGFKTIKVLESFSPNDLTVLIGPNGVGKSNFISFFQMMSWMLADPDNLRVYVGEQGGASKLLHDGPSKTREIEVDLTFQTEAGKNQYRFRLVFAAGDSFIFVDERYRFSREIYGSLAPWVVTDVGGYSPQILNKAQEDITARFILTFLRRIIVHQFHNTSSTARMRTKWNIGDGRYLKEDAGNLASVLYRLKVEHPRVYQRILDYVRLILPFFSEFILEPEYFNVLLSWRERNSDQVFDVSQASDGMLRAIALVTLLLQPEEDLPNVLILDEPELGLHPYAINVIGGLISAASLKTQVIIATQSTALVDCFQAEDIVVVERRGRESVFKRQCHESLSEWLEDYSISELWEKNVIGGRP